MSGVAVLAESHISIHTWPEAGYAALDVFMCGKADPDACIPVLREAFKAKRVEVDEILRGQGCLTPLLSQSDVECDGGRVTPGRLPVRTSPWPRSAGFPRPCSTRRASA